MLCEREQVSWWVEPPKGSPSKSSNSKCILGPRCRKFRKRYTGFHSSTVVTSNLSGESTLTIRKVSRSSSTYGTNSRWVCRGCTDDIISACNKLEVYGKSYSIYTLSWLVPLKLFVNLANVHLECEIRPIFQS